MEFLLNCMLGSEGNVIGPLNVPVGLLLKVAHGSPYFFDIPFLISSSGYMSGIETEKTYSWWFMMSSTTSFQYVIRIILRATRKGKLHFSKFNLPHFVTFHTLSFFLIDIPIVPKHVFESWICPENLMFFSRPFCLSCFSALDCCCSTALFHDVHIKCQVLLTFHHCLVVRNMFFFFAYIRNFIIPSGELISFRGVCPTTSQKNINISDQFEYSHFHPASPRSQRMIMESTESITWRPIHLRHAGWVNGWVNLNDSV